MYFMHAALQGYIRYIYGCNYSSDIVMATADQLIAAINITKRSATGAAY